MGVQTKTSTICITFIFSMSEKFCLKWNDFNSNVSKSFGLLRNEEYLHDVTLVSDDNNQMSAHKLVLSTCSEYFRKIFRNNNKHNHPLLCLDGLSSKELTSVLDYIYNGEVQIFQEDLDRFLAIAQKLKLEGLLGGTDDKVEETYDDSGNKVEEEEINLEFNVASTDKSEKQVSQKSKQPIQAKIDGAIALNGNGEGLADVDAKLLEYVEKMADKRLKCKICGNTAKQMSNIKNHIETHLEGLSFPCQVCGKTFRSRNAFHAHKSRNHKGIL